MSQNDTKEMGFHWESEPVSKVFGENNHSDKRVVNPQAQIAVMDNVAKFDAAFPGLILALQDGSSLRVRCQAVGRKFDGKDLEANRTAVLAMMRGTRASVTITRRPLPNGQMYQGHDEAEYRQLVTVAYVDLGIDEDKAIELAKLLPF